MKLSFNRWLITTIFLHVMITKMKEKRENKEARQGIIQALMDSNIPVKLVREATITTTLKYLSHQ